MARSHTEQWLCVGIHHMWMSMLCSTAKRIFGWGLWPDPTPSAGFVCGNPSCIDVMLCSAAKRIFGQGLWPDPTPSAGFVYGNPSHRCNIM